MNIERAKYEFDLDEEWRKNVGRLITPDKREKIVSMTAEMEIPHSNDVIGS